MNVIHENYVFFPKTLAVRDLGIMETASVCCSVISLLCKNIRPHEVRYRLNKPNYPVTEILS